MLRRKFEPILREFLKKSPDKILLVNGARQIGKSYIIRYVCQELFPNYIEIDLRADKESNALFANVKSTDDFYFQLGLIAGNKLGSRVDTMIFLDEIQVYPHLLTMLKFLNQEKRFRYIASGSQLGIALGETPSVPMGSIESAQMYPLDFEEFLWAMGAGEDAIEKIGEKLTAGESIDESAHEYVMKQLKYYLLVGGLPEAVDLFARSRNLFKVRTVQKDIHDLYGIDASQYDKERKLKIQRIYDMIPSNMENRKKRVIYQKIEDKKGKHFADYEDEFDYLINSGISLDVTAISNPKFPLRESESKNLVKLYLNDVGILTSILYGMNANAVINDEKSINLGTVYESFVAQELKAHGFKLFYYDNKKKGEVEFIIDDYNRLSVMPIEVKSGKDYKIHSALDGFISTPDYHINSAIVLSNERAIEQKNGILYMPIYYAMFVRETEAENLILE